MSVASGGRGELLRKVRGAVIPGMGVVTSGAAALVGSWQWSH